jgi:hypothetical protein
LAEARAEVARREEVERKLDRVRIEAASLAIELNQAERDLEEARHTVKPKTAERIAKLEAELAQTRSELEREQASREQLQRDYDAAALQSGAQLKQLREDVERARADTERARAEADEARAELKTHEEELEALRRTHDKELAAAQQELTREEAGRNRDRERLVAIEQLLEAATKKGTGQAAPKGAGRAAPVTAEPPRAEPPRDEPPRAHRPAAEAPQPLADETVAAPITPPKRQKRRKRVFEARGRTCAVCRRTELASPGALKAEGWALGSEIDLCPECQEKGWQLPRSGSLPFRRSPRRGEVG